MLKILPRRCKHATSIFDFIKRGVNTNAYDDDTNYDIIIAGGGMVGTTLACALANNRKLENKKILLLEGSHEQKYEFPEKYSNRVVALNQLTRTLLSSLGAWQHIENFRLCPVNEMQVWDAFSDAAITFNKELLSKELAYIVENDLVLYAVNKQLSDKEMVNVIYNSKVDDVKLPNILGEKVAVKVKDGKEYKAELLVGADGVNSRVRQAMGTQWLKWDYNQMGIVATLKLSESTENTIAWQRFLPTGPIALLPLTDELSSLVWSITSQEAKRLLKLSEEEFVDSINEALWKVYPKNETINSGMRTMQKLLQSFSLYSETSRKLPPSVSNIVEGSRAAFPLGFGHSVNYAKPGVVLIGDAAHRVHPLAGQGVNLGFGDVTCLVQLLAEATINGSLLGDTRYLTKYETARQKHNVPTMIGIEALHRLYTETAVPVVLARSLGLQLTNAIPSLKKMLIQHASNQSPA